MSQSGSDDRSRIDHNETTFRERVAAAEAASQVSQSDSEIEAMQAILDLLAPFDARTRHRMLTWIVAQQAGKTAIDLPLLLSRESDSEC